MDNREIGEVSFQARGRSFTLRYTTAAFVALEEHLDLGILEIYQRLQAWAPPTDAKGKPLAETPAQAQARLGRMRLGFCRAVFWAGFHDMHREITVDDAGDIMTEIGGMMEAFKLIAAGMEAAQQKNEGAATANPPVRPARRRTGSAS